MNVARLGAADRGAGLRVAIAGAGLGGLCLAQGLARLGAEVTVYERDAALDSRRQGYRLHVDARAGMALQRCLPPELFDAVLATCGQPGHSFTVLSERLRILHRVVGPAAGSGKVGPAAGSGNAREPAANPLAPATLSTSVHRQTLREILAAGVDIRFGQPVAGFSTDRDVVTVHLADGDSVRADLLVGADGVGSAVRQRYLPDASTVDTGSRCVYGRTPLTAEVLELLPEPVLDGFTAVVGGPIGMALGTVRFRTPPSSIVMPGLRLTPVGDYVMWALAGAHARFPVPAAELGGLDARRLHRMVEGMVRSWHPRLRGLVARADVDETFLVRVQASVPVPAWSPSRVTVLGDAIHAMSPARGSGANTALRDAQRLCEALTSGDELLDAVGRYEADMREYGYAAVAASRQAEVETGARRNRLAFWLYRRLAR